MKEGSFLIFNFCTAAGSDIQSSVMELSHKHKLKRHNKELQLQEHQRHGAPAAHSKTYMAVSSSLPSTGKFWNLLEIIFAQKRNWQYKARVLSVQDVYFLKSSCSSSWSRNGNRQCSGNNVQPKLQTTRLTTCLSPLQKKVFTPSPPCPQGSARACVPDTALTASLTGASCLTTYPFSFPA